MFDAANSIFERDLYRSIGYLLAPISKSESENDSMINEFWDFLFLAENDHYCGSKAQITERLTRLRPSDDDKRKIDLSTKMQCSV